MRDWLIYVAIVIGCVGLGTALGLIRNNWAPRLISIAVLIVVAVAYIYVAHTISQVLAYLMLAVYWLPILVTLSSMWFVWKLRYTTADACWRW